MSEYVTPRELARRVYLESYLNAPSSSTCPPSTSVWTPIEESKEVPT